jgi:hypothetical protein
MKRMLEIADRFAWPLVVIGLLSPLWVLSSAHDPRHVFWGICALLLACVALWSQIDT